MSAVWFTADLHLGHKKVSDIRGFESTDEHDYFILDNLLKSTSQKDTIWILGDISGGGSSSQKTALRQLKRLNRTMHLIAGNHDGVHPMHRNSFKWQSEYFETFDSVQPFARKRFNKTDIWLSHFPWSGGGDHTATERYSTIRLNDDNESWLIHGHTHSNILVDEKQRMIHVGVDACNFMPVHFEQIGKIIERS